MNQLPETGLLCLAQIIGQTEITEEQAKKNREQNEKEKQDAIAKKRFHLKGTQKGDPKYSRRPTTPRPAIPPLIPVRKSCWWDGIKSGRYPEPVKLGNGRRPFWKVEIILALIASAGKGAMT